MDLLAKFCVCPGAFMAARRIGSRLGRRAEGCIQRAPARAGFRSETNEFHKRLSFKFRLFRLC
jgi:hypothetical protein